MKKRFVKIISIVVIFFFFGSMVHITAVGESSPWEAVWKAILELNERVNDIEEEIDQMKPTRFVDTNEYVVDTGNFATITTFVLNPENISDNAILAITYYAEYTIIPKEPGYHAEMSWLIEVNGVESYAHTVRQYTMPPPIVYKWTPTYNWESRTDGGGYSRNGIIPNQESYTIDFKVHTGAGTAYIRNINVIITVADGLPAS